MILMSEKMTSQNKLYEIKLVPYNKPLCTHWGRTNKWMDEQMDEWTNGQIFTQYSGISSAR